MNENMYTKVIRALRKCRPQGEPEHRPWKWWLRQATYDNDIDVDNILQPLNKRQRLAVIAYYVDGQTLEEIGKELNLTRERVRQICESAVELLRHYNPYLG